MMYWVRRVRETHPGSGVGVAREKILRSFWKLYLWVQLLFVFSVGVKGRGAMDKKMTEQTLQQRIKSGKIRREDVARRLAELAFGKVNDCVRLVLEDDPAVEKLDLGQLCEIKRNDKGAVEIKLVDRLRALEQLCQLAEQEGTDVESFLKALSGGGENG